MQFRRTAIVAQGGGIFGVTASLVATLNGQGVFEQVITVGADQSLHRIIDSDIVQPADPKLTLLRKSRAGAGTGTGTIQLSDFVYCMALVAGKAPSTAPAGEVLQNFNFLRGSFDRPEKAGLPGLMPPELRHAASLFPVLKYRD